MCRVFLVGPRVPISMGELPMTFSSLWFCTAPCETDVCTRSQHTPCRTKTDARGEVSARGEETGLEPKWGYSVCPSSFPPPSVPSFLHFSPVSLSALALLLLHPTPAPLEVDPVRLAAGQGFSGKRQTACSSTPLEHRHRGGPTEEAPRDCAGDCASPTPCKQVCRWRL